MRISIWAHIFKLAKQIEERWKQRLGARWLKLGDNNTKYFHAVANDRKDINHISLTNEVTGQQVPTVDLNVLLFNHFNELLGTRQASQTPFDLTGRIGQQWIEELSVLYDPVTEEEIKNVVFKLPEGKASGPDGLPTEFYQNYWDIVGPDVVACILDFYEGKNITRINKVAITLVPKKRGATSTADFRPISVINTSAKIITKIL